jgi:hypothetical protein
MMAKIKGRYVIVQNMELGERPLLVSRLSKSTHRAFIGASRYSMINNIFEDVR